MSNDGQAPSTEEIVDMLRRVIETLQEMLAMTIRLVLDQADEVPLGSLQEREQIVRTLREYTRLLSER